MSFVQTIFVVTIIFLLILAVLQVVVVNWKER
jgi:hypothetical protein